VACSDTPGSGSKSKLWLFLKDKFRAPCLHNHAYLIWH
jgi:hypothetical protein